MGRKGSNQTKTPEVGGGHMFFHKTIFQPVGDDTEDCRIELEPREEKSITVHFIANRTVGVCVIQEMNSNLNLLLIFKFYHKYLK